MSSVKVGDRVATNDLWLRALRGVCSDATPLRGTVKRLSQDGCRADITVRDGSVWCGVHVRYLEREKGV